MKNNERNKFRMIDSVVSHLSGNQSVTAGTPSIAERMNELNTILDKIRIFEGVQMNAARAASIAKAEARKKAETAGSTIAGKLYDYGVKTGNTYIADKHYATITDFKRVNEITLLVMLIAIRDDARTNLPALEAHGVTQEVFDEYSATVDNFIDANANKNRAFIQRSASKKAITSLMEEADGVLRALDRLVEEFRTADPVFFNAYRSARSIKDLGFRRKKDPDVSQTPSGQ